MKEFIGPFDLRNITPHQARVAFSETWRRFYPATNIHLKALHFIAADLTHIIFSPEFELGGPGFTKEDAHCKLIATCNGLYSNFLIEGNFPSYRPKQNGMASLKRHLESLGWAFQKTESDKYNFNMPTLAQFIIRQPLFKENVLEKTEVFEMDIEIELPDIKS
jgi:hypothetical protein